MEALEEGIKEKLSQRSQSKIATSMLLSPVDRSLEQTAGRMRESHLKSIESETIHTDTDAEGSAFNLTPAMKKEEN